MLIDANDLPSETAEQADVCIVGAGAAGITLALELAAAGKTVVLLESGGFEFEEASQALYLGYPGGTFLKPEERYLTRSRLRRFGGTTGHWNGWCAPLQSSDFEPRSWIPDSGWPIGESALQPHYQRAADYLEIEAGFERVPSLLRDDPVFEPFYFSISPPIRFGLNYRQRLQESLTIRVIVHANLVEMVASDNGQGIAEVVCSTLAGERVRVRARSYVLACGAIENARLLLTAKLRPNQIHPTSETIGKYFMDHPIQRMGRVLISKGRDSRMLEFSDRLGARHKGGRRGLFRPRPSICAERSWPNALVSFTRKQRWWGGEFVPSVARASRRMAQLAETPGQFETAAYFGQVSLIIEQRPNPASQVTMTDDLDPLGMPRVRLDWQVDDEDRRALIEIAQAIATSVGASLEGRVGNFVASDFEWEGTGGSNHHIGTTRMANDPNHGTVDPNCKVFGVNNLYVAGSSVFPTAAAVNPTFTIVALATRLADHLREVS